jgi:DNA-binding MarR family transcriptional regulator
MNRDENSGPARSVLHRFQGMVMREIMGNLSAMIQSYELTPAQISTLFRLRGQEALLVSSISEQLKLSSGTSSHLVERLVQRGLVTRSETAEDRRQRMVHLTPEGRDFLEQFDMQFSATLTELLKDVPEEVMSRFTETLEVVMAHMSKP